MKRPQQGLFFVFKLFRSKSLNEQAVKLHLLEDIFGWVAILISAIVMKFIAFPQLDIILSILIAGWVIYNAIKNLVKTFKIMLQAIFSEKAHQPCYHRNR